MIPKSSQSIVDSIPDANEPPLTLTDIRNMDEGVEVIDVKAISYKEDK